MNYKDDILSKRVESQLLNSGIRKLGWKIRNTRFFQTVNTPMAVFH